MNIISACFVDTGAVDGTDNRFLIGLPESGKSLEDSIKKVGQLYPILVKEEGGKFIIVDGFRRYYTLLKLGVPRIMIASVPTENGSDRDYYLTHAHSIISQRPLYEIEKADILTACVQRFKVPLDEFGKNYAPVFGIAMFPRISELYERVIGVTAHVKAYLLAKNIRLQMLSVCAAWDEESFTGLLELGGVLQVGSNKLKLFLTLLDEVSRRDGKSPAAVLKENNIPGIIRSRSITESQKWERVLELLNTLRYPEWERISREIKASVKDLNLPRSIRLSYPEYLEGDNLEMNISFRSENELCSLAGILSGMSGSAGLKKILKWIE